MAKMTSTGVKLAIALGAPATLTEAGYGDKTFVDVGELTTIPEFGPTITVVESNPLATGVTEKFVGFINNGSVALEADFDDEDDGQAMITDATTFGNAAFGQPHSFELTYLSGAKRYFVGKFFSSTENPGSANSMVTTGMNVEIDSAILKVSA